MKTSELKLIIKEIVKGIQTFNEGMYDVKNYQGDEDSSYGGWLDPNGKFHVVAYEGHYRYARQVLQQLGMDTSDAYDKLYKLGFVRVVFSDSELYYRNKSNDGGPSVPMTQRKMKELKDLAIEHGCRVLHDCDSNNITSDLDESQNLEEDMSYEELLKLTTPERKDKASNVTTRSLPVSVENNNEQWNFRYKSSPQTTVTDKPFRGSITFLKGKVGQNNDASKMKCKVDCQCPDFMYRFAYNDAAKGASQVGPNSLNKAANRKPKPAYDYGEGLCKHLVALGKFLKTKIQSTKKSNLFEAIDEVSNQGPFNVTYYD